MKKFILPIIIFGIVLIVAFAWYNNRQKSESGLASPSSVVAVGQIHKHTDDYVIYADYPIFKESKIDSQIKKYAEQEVEDFISSLDEDIDHEHAKYDSYDHVKSEMHFSYRVPLANENIVVVEFDEHNNRGDDKAYDVVNTKIFRRDTGEEIGLTDIFDTSTDFLPELSSVVRDELEKQSLETSQSNLLEGSGERMANFSTFELLSDNDIEFIFEPGQVADESEGVVRVIIPLSNLKRIVDQEVIDFVYHQTHVEKYESDKKIVEKKIEATAAPTTAPTTTPTKVTESADKVVSLSGSGCSSDKCIALTFDDGPAGPTPQLLDTLLNVLKDRGVKATFFQLGKNVSVYQSLLQRMVNEGHQIGMHSWDHPQLTRLSSAEIQDQFSRTSDVISQATGGYQSQIVRPPYGAINQTVRDAIPHAQILWSVDPEDWKDRNSDTVFQRVTSETGPGDIVLSHDIHQTTVDAYPRIIDFFKNEGYEFVTVGELLGFEENGYPSGGKYSSR